MFSFLFFFTLFLQKFNVMFGSLKTVSKGVFGFGFFFTISSDFIKLLLKRIFCTGKLNEPIRVDYEQIKIGQSEAEV